MSFAFPEVRHPSTSSWGKVNLRGKPRHFGMSCDRQMRNLMNETNKMPIGNGYEKLRNEMKLMEIMTAFKRFVATQSS